MPYRNKLTKCVEDAVGEEDIEEGFVGFKVPSAL
jgi:hypothetical protein